MIFEREKYYKLMKDLENGINIIYIIIMFFSVIIGIAAGVVTLIITIPLGLLIAYFMTFATKIKVQEMKWKIDVHNKLNKN